MKKMKLEMRNDEGIYSKRGDEEILEGQIYNL